MNNITYEQFIEWCQYWKYTEEEGYRAMCFVANIIAQNYNNNAEYAEQVRSKENHSDAFKNLVEKNKDNALLLLELYNELDSKIYNMLEKDNTAK